jgi:HTH-type transcriptional regulator/antitoxin HipB
MKTEWDSYLDQQLTNPSIRQAYEEETQVLSIGVQLARQRKRKGLTQAELARKIGTSTPQLSRTERRPENVNMRTLIRYAEAVGMNLDVRLIAKKSIGRKARPSIPDSAIIVSASSASRLPSAPQNRGAARP